MGSRKLQFLGSSCIYPKFAPQPMTEDCLLTGPLEPTNEWYAIAKIAGIKMCQAYRRQYGFDAISLMPTNLYGPGDNFDLANSHVLPALIRKFHEAKVSGAAQVVVWGTGTPRREFLHVDDLADACLFLMQGYEDEGIINVGVGEDISIAELAALVQRVVGFEGEHRARSQQARRHAAQAAGCLAPPRARLARPHRAGRRHPGNLPVVSGARDGSAVVGAESASSSA